MLGPSLFGKLPRQRDFVRVDMDYDAAIQLDQWVAANLERLLERGLRQSTGAIRFLLPFDTGRCVGVMVPSRDQARRQYPLLIFCCAEAGVTASTAGLYLSAAGFLEAAEAAARDAATQPLEEVQAAVRGLPVPTPGTRVRGAPVVAKALLRTLFGSLERAAVALCAARTALLVPGPSNPMAGTKVDFPVPDAEAASLCLKVISAWSPSVDPCLLHRDGRLLVLPAGPGPSDLVCLGRRERGVLDLQGSLPSSRVAAVFHRQLEQQPEDIDLDTLLGLLADAQAMGG